MLVRGSYASVALLKSGEKGGAQMSRNMLIVVSVVTVLLAMLIAPTTIAPLKVDGAAYVQTESWFGPGGGPSLALPIIQPDGGCEGGGASGCPVGS
jgi:hypothetical protein